MEDTFETRIYLMFFHFSLLMMISKKKGEKFDQKTYDYLFHNIEYNLRELGFGDVTVNKKMKEFNKILYDILLKLDLEKEKKETLKINTKLIKKYFSILNQDDYKIAKFNDYLTNFYNYCFELPPHNMIKEAINFKY